MYQGGPLFSSFMEYASLAAAGGAVGEAALLQAGEMAIMDHTDSRKLQIHGHYREEADLLRAGKVTRRIEDCIELWDVKPFIGRLFGVGRDEKEATHDKAIRIECRSFTELTGENESVRQFVNIAFGWSVQRNKNPLAGSSVKLEKI